MDNKSIFKIKFCFFLLLIVGSCKMFGQKTDSTSVADSALLKQIEAQMNQPQQPQQTTPQVRSGASYNPDIGVIGDFQGSYISKGKRNFDLYLNETEVSLQSNVDPYLRADFFLTFGRDPETLKYGAAVEEGYLKDSFIAGTSAIKSRKVSSSSW